MIFFFKNMFLIKFQFFLSFRPISSTMIFFFESIFDLSAGTFPFSYGWIRKGVANRGKQFGSLRSHATEIEFYAERRY